MQNDEMRFTMQLQLVVPPQAVEFEPGQGTKEYIDVDPALCWLELEGEPLAHDVEQVHEFMEAARSRIEGVVRTRIQVKLLQDSIGRNENDR